LFKKKMKKRRKLESVELGSYSKDSGDEGSMKGGYYDEVVRPQWDDDALRERQLLMSPNGGSSNTDGEFLAGHFTRGWFPRKPGFHPWTDTKLSTFNFLAVGAYWFGWSFVWLPMIVIILPKQMSTIMGHENKGQGMGKVLMIGSIGSLIFSPLFGTMSDRSRNVMGRRRPFIVFGTFFNTIGMLIMAFSPPFNVYVLGFSILSFGNFVTMAPYAALVPDVVPPDQRGKASGWLGALSMLGFLSGGGLCYNIEALGIPLTYFLMVCVNVTSVWVTVAFVPEVRVALTAPDFSLTECICAFFVAFTDHDFFWVFLSRFFIQMGSTAVQENLQFYLLDSLGENYEVFRVPLASNEMEAATVLFVPLLTGALLSSMMAGYLSDLWGGERKRLIYISGSVMAATCIGFGLNGKFFWDIILALIFGFGFGIFSAIDWALATDVLPDADNYGKDMGLWNLAFTLPQIVVGPVIGKAIDGFRKNGAVRLGWFIIFCFVAASFLIGTYLVKKVHKVK